MANVFDYLKWRGDLTVYNTPFNAVDGMILARLSYLPLGGIVPNNGTTVGEACTGILESKEKRSKLLMKDDEPFAQALVKSKRFAGMGVFGFENTLSAETQTQFSAVTVKTDSNMLFVSFRGTDNTLIGWKEDFNMTFEFPVPSQRLAVKYLEQAAAKHKNVALLVGGHSKGGNLAVYSSAFCSDEIRTRIRSVYNYDGPGFPDEALRTNGYRDIRPRVNTYVPQSSIVGMLLGHEEKYTIVHSAQTGLMQHDVYSWDVLPSGFEELHTVDNGSKLMDYTFKAWVASLEPDKREQFFDTVYSLLLETNVTTLHEMSEKKLVSALAVLKSFKNLDEGTRKSVTGGIALLFKCARNAYSVFKTREAHT